jgi:hypothetical protein
MGGVGPHVACRVPANEHLFQLRTVMRGGICLCPSAAQTVRLANRDVVLLARGWNNQIDGLQRAVLIGLGLGVVDRPARIAILLRQLGRLALPAVGCARP